MKLKNIVLYLVLGLTLWVSCTDDETKTILDTNDVKASVLSLNNVGESLVLLRENAGDIIGPFTWTAADYGMVLDVYYKLEMDYTANGFANPKVLITGKDFSYDLTVAFLNSKLMADSMPADVPVSLSFRVTSLVNVDKAQVASNVVDLLVTPYSDAVNVNVDPIYLLGGGTSAGWNNNAEHVIPAVYLPASGTDSTFAVVDSLTPAGTEGSDGFLKFVRFIGLWAPQWGTDATGTSESGPLVLRPTESEPDPAAIPVPDVQDDYLIKVDIVNLSYTITETVQTLHIIGDATDADWTIDEAIPMEKLAPGKFQLVANLNAEASEGFKFVEFQGSWEPMYGQESGTWDEGFLKYRPVGAPDVTSIAPPPTTGSYLIEVDIARGTYKLTAQ